MDPDSPIDLRVQFRSVKFRQIFMKLLRSDSSTSSMLQVKSVFKSNVMYNKFIHAENDSLYSDSICRFFILCQPEFQIDLTALVSN